MTYRRSAAGIALAASFAISAVSAVPAGAQSLIGGTVTTVTNIVPVAIDGVPVVGSTIGAQPGLWAGVSALAEYSYRWQRCDADGARCQDIAGATAPSYMVNAADACSTLRVTETLEDLGLTTAVVSEPSTAVAGNCSAIDTLPVIDTPTGGTPTGGTPTGGTGGSGNTSVTTPSGTVAPGTTGAEGSAISSASADATTPAAPGHAGATANARAATCMKLVSRRRTVRVRAMAAIRLSVAANGCITRSAPLRVSVRRWKGGPLKSVGYRVGATRMKASKRSNFVAAVTPAKLRPGRTWLHVRIATKAGKVRNVKLMLHFAWA